MSRFPFLLLPTELQAKVVTALPHVPTIRSLLSIPEVSQSLRGHVKELIIGSGCFQYFSSDGCTALSLAECQLLLSSAPPQDDSSIYLIEVHVHSSPNYIEILNLFDGRHAFVSVLGVPTHLPEDEETYHVPDAASFVRSCNITSLLKQFSDLRVTAIHIEPGCQNSLLGISQEPHTHISIGDVHRIQWLDVPLTQTHITLDGDVQDFESESIGVLSGQIIPTSVDSFTLDVPVSARQTLAIFIADGSEEAFSRAMKGLTTALENISFLNLRSEFKISRCRSLRNVTLSGTLKGAEIDMVPYMGTPLHRLPLTGPPLLQDFIGSSLVSILLSSYAYFPNISNVSLPNIRELTICGHNIRGVDFFKHLDLSEGSSLLKILSNLHTLRLEHYAIMLLGYSEIYPFLHNLATLELNHWLARWDRGSPSQNARRYIPRCVTVDLPRLKTLSADVGCFDPVEILSNVEWPKNWELETLNVMSSVGLVSPLSTFAKIGFAKIKFLSVLCSGTGYSVSRSDVVPAFTTVVGSDANFLCRMSNLEKLELFTMKSWRDVFDGLVAHKLKKLDVKLEWNYPGQNVDPLICSVDLTRMKYLQELVIAIAVRRHSEETGTFFGLTGSWASTIDKVALDVSHKLKKDHKLQRLRVTGDVTSIEIKKTFSKLADVDLTMPLTKEVLEFMYPQYGPPMRTMDCPIESLDLSGVKGLRRLVYKPVDGEPKHNETVSPFAEVEMTPYDLSTLHFLA